MESHRVDSLAPYVDARDAVGFEFGFHLRGGDEGEIGAGVDEAEGSPGHFFDAGDEAQVVSAVEGEMSVIA